MYNILVVNPGARKLSKKLVVTSKFYTLEGRNEVTFHTEHTQILSATAQNLVAWASKIAKPLAFAFHINTAEVYSL